MMNGYNQKGVEIDLSSGSITEFEIPDEVIQQYLGGRGIGSYYLSRKISPGIDPLSPENVLVLSAGGLSGSISPSSGRFSVTFKSPLSGTICSANSGGFWGNTFRRTGFDVCVIRGRADVPVYIYLADDQATIFQCPSLWGKSIPELTDHLYQKYSKAAKVIGIGVAGEKEVRFASMMNDYNRAVGRGGGGAVMGSKNLKAIVVKGNKKFSPANEALYQTGLYQANKLVKNLPITSRALTELGTPGLVELIYQHDMLPRNNFSNVNHRPEDIDRISGETLRMKIFETSKSCFNCSIRCGRATRVGKKRGEGPEYETIAMMGANLGIYNLQDIALANYLCNETGLDTISLGGTIALAMELFEKGMIDHSDTGGLEPRFGAGDMLQDMVQLTAHRNGFGDLLADGASRLGDHFGSQELAMVVKGLEFPGYDPRASMLQALGYATSPRGGCHLKGGYAVCLGFFGGSREVSRFLMDTAAGHCVEAQDAGCITDALGVCRFISYSVSENELSRIYTGYTGLDMGPEDFKAAARRIQNLERRFNIREGFKKSDDTLPQRMFCEKVSIGGTLRAIDETGQFETMLRKYYEIREWDEHGIPPAEGLVL